MIVARSHTRLAVASLLALAAASPLSLAQAPAIIVPGGTDILGETFKAPGAWPGKVSAANFDNRTAAAGVLNGPGSNYLEHNIISGPTRWTIAGSNEGDLDINISPFAPADPRSYPGAFWQSYRNTCGGATPVPAAPVATTPAGACNDWGRWNGVASGPVDYSWSLQPALGLVLASVRDNGRDNLNTNGAGGPQVGTQWATAWISADDFRGSNGYSMIDGTLRNGLGSIYASMSSVGFSEEIITDVSYGWFPYQQGWVGGYTTARNITSYPTPGVWLVAATGPDRIAASPGLAPSVVQWSARGRADIALGAGRTPATGMLFTTSTQADSNTPVLIGTLATATGWNIAIRSAEITDTTGTLFTEFRSPNSDSFAFTYVPFNAPGLIGGTVDPNGVINHSAGSFTIIRTAAGEYTLNIPGKTDANGAIFIQITGSIPGDPTLPDRAFATRKFDTASGTFRIQTRELTTGGDTFGEAHPLRDAGFSFFWTDFASPLKPKCVGDYNNDGTLSVQDIFDFLSGWFAGNILADVEGNGSLAVQDIFDFLNAWFAGC